MDDNTLAYMTLAMLGSYT